MKKFYVTCQEKNGIYCVAIYCANTRETVELYCQMKRRSIIDIHPAMPAELLEAERKHVPIITL